MTEGTAVRRRLPGKPTPRAEALLVVQDAVAERRRHVQPVLWPFFAPEPDAETFRWRIQLDCGCVHEVLSSRKDSLPTERKFVDPVHQAWLPPGQIVCCTREGGSSPYREIVEWGERREITFPADPAEPQHGLDAEDWAKMRHDEPHTSAFWKVTLSCGHVSEVATGPEWKPADGPRRPSPERLEKRRGEWREYLAALAEKGAQPTDNELHHMRMMEQGWPRPFTETDCSSCLRARPIVAYEAVGPLLAPAPKPKASTPASSRANLERRLRQAEAEARQLREQLDSLGGH